MRLRLPEKDAEHGHGPVSRGRRGMKGGMPLPDVPVGDIGHPHVPEPGQDLVVEIIPVHLPGAGLPVPLAGFEQSFGDVPEPGLFGIGVCRFPAALYGG